MKKPRKGSLQSELEDLEQTDPKVRAAARTYDETVRRICSKPLSDVERAACSALAELRKLPESKQGEAFVLMVKLVVEGAAIPIDREIAR
jgi:hypothetical protein